MKFIAVMLVTSAVTFGLAVVQSPIYAMPALAALACAGMKILFLMKSEK